MVIADWVTPPHHPTPLYLWRADGDHRACWGVTDSPERAQRLMLHALIGLPGGRGVVHVGRLDPWTRPPGYAYISALVTAEYDQATGHVVVEVIQAAAHHPGNPPG